MRNGRVEEAMQEKAKAKDAEINANKAEQQKKNEIDKIRGVEGGNNRNKKENGKSSNGGDNFNKNMKALNRKETARISKS